ncbi:disease resistance protein PIK6-NP-like [Triticum aestivum]|uniref:disease resistance protein PIK6-NP-like n=1 Tax=Triticum aestivum TaxID=4565 RepID=UPI001D0020FD|nr:disease resistance protein PIK6-NP-like [Triticum aestivum]XP_044432602.1 disease resistance protein PIK6-NP-like [Triticum aestivum]
MEILETRPEFSGLKSIFSWMQSYFDACSDALKPCIFYLSVFHADYNIRRRRLLRRWIAEGGNAEGYYKDRFGISADEDGEMLFSELIKLSIIQYPPNTNASNSKVKDMFQVNGFFHGYIMSRRMDDNLVFAPEGRCSPSLQCAGQHLTISTTWDRDESVFKSMDLSRLRSFTVFGKWRSFFVSKGINMALLRVLDLEDTSSVSDGDLEKIVKLLPCLKFLSLRGCEDITCLPDSVGGLRQLQTLDVRHTCIVELPASISKLQNLQYIRAGSIRA